MVGEIIVAGIAVFAIVSVILYYRDEREIRQYEERMLGAGYRKVWKDAAPDSDGGEFVWERDVPRETQPTADMLHELAMHNSGFHKEWVPMPDDGTDTPDGQWQWRKRPEVSAIPS